MKKQNLQNGIFILVISGVFYHTFTLPMKPKVGRGIASVTSRYCDERTGAGLVGSVCYGEDWWLPSSVEENSPYGTVYAYSPNQNSLRFVSGFEGNTKYSSLFGDLVDGGSGSENTLGHLRSIWYPNTEYYCSNQGTPIAKLVEDSLFPWNNNLLSNSRETDGIAQDANGNRIIIPGFSTLPADQVRTCRELEAFYSSTVPGNASVIGKDLYKNDFIKRIAHHGWYIETGDGMSLNSDNQLLTNYNNFMSATDQIASTVVRDRLGNFAGSSLNTIDLFKSDTFDTNWQRISSVYERYGAFLNGGGSTTNGANLLDNFWVIWLNGEAGLWSYYLLDDFVCLKDDTSGNCVSNGNKNWTEIAEAHTNAITNSGLDGRYYMINIGNGGTLFKPFEDEVYDNELSMGNHGAFGVFNSQFLQHFRHLQYDDSLKAFVSDYDRFKPYMLHIDLETMFGNHSNLWGDYRLFRLSALSALAYRMNSLVTMSTGIIAQGGADCRGNQRCLNVNNQFNAGLLDYSGALKMHTWLKKVIGREKNNSVDGWCAPMHMGAELSEDSLEEAITEFQNSLTVFDSNPNRKDSTIHRYNFSQGTYKTRSGGDPYRDWAVYAPLKTFVGHHCKMTTQGQPGIKLNPSWTGYRDCLTLDSDGEVDVSGTQLCLTTSGSDDSESSNWILTQKELSGRVLADSPLVFDETSYPYEGRGTDEDHSAIEFEFDSDLFKNEDKNQIIVKIVLRPKVIQSGLFQGEIGVTFSQEGAIGRSVRKVLRTSDFDSRAKYISTLTYKFNRQNQKKAKVRITNLGAKHFDYLMVRVIPTEE
jgi:hypothetical protein